MDGSWDGLTGPGNGSCSCSSFLAHAEARRKQETRWPAGVVAYQTVRHKGASPSFNVVPDHGSRHLNHESLIGDLPHPLQMKDEQASQSPTSTTEVPEEGSRTALWLWLVLLHCLHLY
jgi:hypothetical protein